MAGDRPRRPTYKLFKEACARGFQRRVLP